MIGSGFLRAARGSIMQSRHASGFNKYPAKAVKPFGLGGNAMLIFGTVFFVATVALVQRSGYLLPHAIGPGLSPIGRLEIDLTPEELKN